MKNWTVNDLLDQYSWMDYMGHGTTNLDKGLPEDLYDELNEDDLFEMNDGFQMEEPTETEDPVETLENVIAEVIDAYICESVQHFLSTRSRKVVDDGRYFYSTQELIQFKEKFLDGNGDLSTLHIGVVRNENDEFFCYEVCRKGYYERDKNNNSKMFYS